MSKKRKHAGNVTSLLNTHNMDPLSDETKLAIVNDLGLTGKGFHIGKVQLRASVTKVLQEAPSLRVRKGSIYTRATATAIFHSTEIKEKKNKTQKIVQEIVVHGKNDRYQVEAEQIGGVKPLAPIISRFQTHILKALQEAPGFTAVNATSAVFAHKLLISAPACLDQEGHVDYLVESSNENKNSFSVIVAVLDNTRLRVWPRSHQIIQELMKCTSRKAKLAKIEQLKNDMKLPLQVEILTLRKGEYVIFRHDLVSPYCLKSSTYISMCTNHTARLKK